MRKLKVKRLGILFFIVFALLSCSKNSDIENNNKENINGNFVTLSQVNDIANSILYPTKDKDLKNSTKQSHTKTVSNVTEIKNYKSQTSFYIINYIEGGFVIISADKRTQPILGFSVSNTFSVDKNSYPEGLNFWLNDTKRRIADIQESNIEQTENEKNCLETC